MVISPDEYTRFKELLQSQTGILLGDNKQYLVASRLSSFLKESEISSFGELLQKLNGFSGTQLLQKVIDRMTTNETLWFRDNFPFHFLISDILPELKKQNQLKASIWCAACSTGQEPYSISMAIEEVRRNFQYTLPNQVDILATDISSRVLEQARKGEYQSLEITRGLSPERQKLHFDKNELGTFFLKPNIKSRVQFMTANLMKLPYRHLGKFDVIFCRNVLIYFSMSLKEAVIQGLSDCLNPGGYLFLGASESMPPNIRDFTMVRCNPGLVYQKKK